MNDCLKSFSCHVYSSLTYQILKLLHHHKFQGLHRNNLDLQWHFLHASPLPLSKIPLGAAQLFASKNFYDCKWSWECLLAPCNAQFQSICRPHLVLSFLNEGEHRISFDWQTHLEKPRFILEFQLWLLDCLTVLFLVSP